MITEHTLKNPLDKFVTYSTHFVILAARTTSELEPFLSDAARSREDKAELDQKALVKIDSAGQLGDALPGTRGSVFLVMDTRRFSQFTVESFKNEVYINGLSAGGTTSNVSTTMEMRVLDSVGISFINYMQWLMDSKLHCNFDGMIFVIKVLFVGTNADGTSETVQTVAIPALLFKMQVDLSYSKGVYDLEWQPILNFSLRKHGRWLNIGKVTSYFTGGGKQRLGDMVASFEGALNRASSKFYNSLAPQLLDKDGGVKDTKGKFGRMVQYQITLPEKWEGLTFTGRSVNSAVERDFVEELKLLEAKKTPQQQKSSAEGEKKDIPTKDAHFTAPPAVLITDVLDLMFSQVNELQKFANADQLTKSDGVLTFYKHVVGISSSDDVMIVHVDVVPFEVPNLPPPSKKTTTVSQHMEKHYQTTKDGRRIPKNYFNLDYIFTGRNTDVLNFDMKIQNLQFMLATNVRVSEGDNMQKALLGQRPEDEKPTPARIKEVLNLRRYDPIFLPLLTEEELKSFSNYVTPRSPERAAQMSRDSQEYARNLATFYAISPIQVALTLRGNPDIFTKFSISQSAPHISFYTNTGEGGISVANGEARRGYRQEFERKILQLHDDKIKQNGNGTFAVNNLGSSTYVSAPCFVTVKVMGPNVDFRTNEPLAGQDFATEVLYDNYYVVFKVTNIIEQGVFTQQLELWSHNVFGAGTKLSKAQLEPVRQA